MNKKAMLSRLLPDPERNAKYFIATLLKRYTTGWGYQHRCIIIKILPPSLVL